MDFIERWFNISPDGVSGTLEVLYVAAFILLIAFIIIRLRRYLISCSYYGIENNLESTRAETAENR